MDDQNQRNKSILPIIFIIIQIIYMIIIISVLLSNTKNDRIEQMDIGRQPTISIKDLNSQLPDNAYRGPIETVLTKTVELNSTEFNTSDSTANIREGSLSTVKFEDIDGIYFSAIVDIPNLEQSYQIYSFYSIGDRTPESLAYSTQYVLCLDDQADKIYPDFDCQELFPQDARRSIVFSYLKYLKFNDFSLFPTQKPNSSIIYIDVDPTLDISTDTEQSYIQETKKAVSSLGISPELFEYKINRQSNIVDL